MKLILLFTIISFNTLAQISVSNPIIRLLPPMSKTTAAFISIKNSSDKNISLIKVVGSSSIVNKIELHTHKKVNNIYKMREVFEIEILKNSTTDLKPGGFHIMLIGLVRPLKIGQNVNMTLVFSNNKKMNILFKVEKTTPIDHVKMNHHKM